MVAALLDILDKMACGLARLLAVNKTDRKGQNVASPGISLDPAIAPDVGIVECGLDLPVKAVEMGGFLGLAEDLGGHRRELGTEGEAGGEYDVFRSVGAELLATRHPQLATHSRPLRQHLGLVAFDCVDPGRADGYFPGLAVMIPDRAEG